MTSKSESVDLHGMNPRRARALQDCMPPFTVACGAHELLARADYQFLQSRGFVSSDKRGRMMHYNATPLGQQAITLWNTRTQEKK